MAELPSAELGAVVRHLRARFDEGGVKEAALDARLLVEHITATTRADAMTDPGRHVPPAQMAALLAAMERRLAGEPPYRIIGSREFYGMTLALSEGTLEPRPDTETLVDLALPRVRAAADRHGACRILDLGTGTGAVALALLREEPRAVAVATDISLDALATATRNANMSGNAGRFDVAKSNWFDDVKGSFHAIVSNPPYIPSMMISSLEREVREHDPLAALDGGPDGLAPYRMIAEGARRHLHTDGFVAVEIGYDQEEAVKAIFASQGFQLFGAAQDLSGTTRALAFG
ncbi:peptide chain release factor N(5)-glutamine methyltransferase [Mesorhizobium sp. CAU 1741]|uniref:peptide chain release factor N(5)-glutamine methyltransferase n=1 Tax=Mesorhizobium sp. CAU 1741 TaxID=3140366 RepID=UPI00325A45FA